MIRAHSNDAIVHGAAPAGSLNLIDSTRDATMLSAKVYNVIKSILDIIGFYAFLILPHGTLVCGARVCYNDLYISIYKYSLIIAFEFRNTICFHPICFDRGIVLIYIFLI